MTDTTDGNSSANVYLTVVALGVILHAILKKKGQHN